MPSSSYDGTGADNITTANLVTGVANVTTLTVSGVSTANVINTTGSIYIGDTVNTKSALGLTINQAGAANEILTFKSSDISQSYSPTESDTYGFMKKHHDDYGGLFIGGLSEALNAASALYLDGIFTTVGSKAAITIRAQNIAASRIGATQKGMEFLNYDYPILTLLGDGKTTVYQNASDGTNYEGLQIDPATDGDMKITALTGGTGTDDVNITLTPTGTGKVRMPNHSVRSTTGGGLVRKYYEALSGAMSSGTVTITMGIPANARLLGLQLKVKDLITSGDGGTTWAAAFAGGSTTAIGTGLAFTANTVANVLLGAENTTAGTNIVITPNSGTFSAGNVLGIVYVEELDSI